MKKLIRRLALTLAVLFVLIQFVRPARENPEVNPERAIDALAPPTAVAAGVFDRACADCHSSETRWPWYSHVAPVSWFVIGHVNHARRHMNVSDWGTYDTAEQAKMLKRMCDYVNADTMPLPSYKLIHRDAVLSGEDKHALCEWVERARGGLTPSGADP